jgi:chloramphenicol O-acetyltransferase type A
LTIDVTKFIPALKKENLPFYYTLVYFSNLSANNVEEFRYRIRDGKIIIHDKVHPVFTDLDEGSELFKIVRVEMNDDLKSFITEAAEKSKNQRASFIPGDSTDHDDSIHYSSLPWFSFTQVSQPMNIDRNDSFPRICWGKYFEENKKILLPYSVHVNHALVDGMHINKFKAELEKNLNNFNGR